MLATADQVTHSIIGAFYAVYNTLGFGFRERFYVAALELELRQREHHVAREVGLCVRYKGTVLGRQRVDLLVDEMVVLEVKATELLHSSARMQLFNYLRASDLPLGLLLHFGPRPLVHRIANPTATRARFAVSDASAVPSPRNSA